MKPSDALRASLQMRAGKKNDQPQTVREEGRKGPIKTAGLRK